MLLKVFLVPGLPCGHTLFAAGTGAFLLCTGLELPQTVFEAARGMLVLPDLLTGIGINPGLNAKGEVCVCRNAEEAAKKFKAGQILVVPFTTNDTLPYMRQAAGIIAEEAGANSHSAIVGLTLGKPVIIGATHATRTLKDGMKISMDCARGVVQAMSE